jgi:hypothetical protein
MMQSHRSTSDRYTVLKIKPQCLVGFCIAISLSTVPVTATEDKAKDYEILLIGNSHSSRNNLPGLVAILIETGLPSKSVRAQTVPRWGFLDDHLQDDKTRRLLESQSWTHVILQAQKYSSSGRYYYPTTAAEELIRRTRLQDAIPVMFPEWPRRGNTEEGQRVHELHLQIAAREPACVAPVGLAWQLVLEQNPSLKLHARDGNHSNRNGALLTAYVLYEVITGKPAAELPSISSLKVAPETQELLRKGASETMKSQSYCP